MFADHEEWLDDENEDSPFKIYLNQTLDQAEKHVNNNLMKNLQNIGWYDSPILIDWDSISGAATEDTAEKLIAGEAVAKQFGSKPHLMKNFTENWSAVRGLLPVVFVGVLQEKEKISESGRSAFAAPQKSYAGGNSQLFKASTLLSFSLMGQLPNGNGKIVRIKTALNGFADARQIEAKFVWDQFGSLEEESQGHKWLFSEASARLLATPKLTTLVGDILPVASLHFV